MTISSKVVINCTCGKELVEQFNKDESFLENHDIYCECGQSYVVGKPFVYDRYDETEIRVVFHCKQCGSLLNAYFEEDPDDKEYDELDQVECDNCGIWYEVKTPPLPTVKE